MKTPHLFVSILSLSMFGFAGVSHAAKATKAWAVAHNGVPVATVEHAAGQLTSAINTIKVAPGVAVSSAKTRAAAEQAKFPPAGVTALFQIRSRAFLRDSTDAPGSKASMLFAVTDLVRTITDKANGAPALDTAVLRTFDSNSQIGLVDFADPGKTPAK